MISFEQAYDLVLDNLGDFGEVVVPLAKTNGRVLAEPIYADRDFPPFDRATKDGIAIAYGAVQRGKLELKIEGVAAAGSPEKVLVNPDTCIEIMTGAMLPKNTDTVVMYEHLTLKDGFATLEKPVKKGQNIHGRGSDEPEGTMVLQAGIRITAAEIGVLASVGKAMVKVKRNPSLCIVSTGDELVAVDAVPLPHQIRKSNSHTLRAALQDQGLSSTTVHIADDKEATESAIREVLQQYDIVLLSGGVSKGKYDYLPEVFETLGIEKVFHKVRQRPGKPFWFGKHEKSKTTVFAFPGNPGSTFANYHVYFLPWLFHSFGLISNNINVELNESIENTTDLTRFMRVNVAIFKGRLVAHLIEGNGSGDLTSLSKANGFIRLKPNQNYDKGAEVPFIATRKILE
ncbi:molybdopterin molybdotransferase MoeA [uncultured Croceitalea sp.]|uniref:molybdopterin molybdotransferase MoeA n=1 Tax=uncultured Croceitalea sp. TaxID=1798908 RepID=UPI00330638A3